MTSLIRIPFAESGDKTAVPETDAGGGVNMTQGYGQAYALDPATDPSAKRIEREKMNGLFNLITSAIAEIQASGCVPFITSDDNGGAAYPYGKGAMAILDGVVYQSLEDSNTTTPPGAKWSTLANLKNALSRSNPFGDIASDGQEAIAMALANLRLQNADGSVGRLLNIQTFTSSGTYTPTPGTKRIRVTITGGGGGGSGANGNSVAQTVSGAGGGSAGTAIRTFSNLKSSYSVAIGAGGQGSAGSASAMNGGNSTFDSITAQGGGGGVLSSSGATAGGFGGVPTGGDINIRGGTGSDGQAGQFMLTGNGGASYFGGGGRAGAGAGVSGAAYGCGGGGAYDQSMSGTAKPGGNGAQGICIIEEFA
ncbi:TPA: hypothetical protein JLK53_004058 [Escherichia coli]|nr:hypothetical protein [Escherichia coli]